MASNKRKRVLPKKPERFHSGLEKQLGKNSNKGCYEASLLGIYYNEPKQIKRELTSREEEIIARLRQRT